MLLEGGIEKNYTQNWDKNGNIYYTDENGRVVDFKVNPFVKLANKVKAGVSNFGDWINESNPNSEAYKQKVGLVAGLATAPFGIGELATAGVTRALTPYVGRKIAQNMATGLGSGVVGGGVGGGLEAGLNNENILAGGLKGSILGGLSGLLGGYGLGKVAQKLNTQTAWHGSPYKFDKFSNEAIGTGEGSQSHGYGHYTALNKNKAERYRRELTGDDYNNEKYFYNNQLIGDGNKKAILSTIYQNGKDKVIATRQKNIDRYKYNQEEYLKKIEELNWIKSLNENKIGRQTDKGSLYKLSIPKDNVMLREDLFLSEQPQFQKLYDDVITKKPETYKDMFNNQWIGADLYYRLSKDLGSKELASEYLKNKGIKGISYKGSIDDESRVIFSPDDIDIIPYYDNPTNFKEKFINLLSR